CCCSLRGLGGTAGNTTGGGAAAADDNDEDYEINKKRRLSIKINKDGQPRKKRQHSSEGGPRPVGR
ncbi:unnamed protein product, partial [Rotaria sp. Silwood2]